MENKDVEIFQCRTSSGVIGPGETQYLEWVFRPLEEKDYEVDVPISMVDGKTRMVTFRGSGVNQVVCSSSTNELRKLQLIRLS